MYSLKSIPEDFVVKEKTSVKPQKKGKYALFVLEKKNIGTENAVQEISNALKILRKHIGYAGLKDKKAVTSQLISILNGKKSMEQICFRNFSIKFAGFSNVPVSLGDLAENQFEVVARNLDENAISVFQKNIDFIEKSLFLIPNFFGSQRFSKNNDIIGELIVKKKFQQAVMAVIQNMESRGSYEHLVSEHIKKKPGDFVGGLRKIPKKILSLFISSYQSRIFNQVLNDFFKQQKSISIATLRNAELPVVGFGSQLKNCKTFPKCTLNLILEKIMKKEHLRFRDFIIPQIPELSSEGTTRKILVKIKGLKAMIGGDELNKGKKKLVLRFSLPKSSYATVALEQMFKH